MNIQDLDQLAAEDGRTRLGSSIPDSAGNESHLLIIEGRADLVRSIFTDADFGISIAPHEGREDWEDRVRQAFPDRPGTGAAPDEVLDPGLFKPTPELATKDNSVVVILQRTQAGGTSYLLTLPFALPAGMSIFFVLPPVCGAAGISVPATGDPDVFLMLTPAGPTVAASTFVGLFPDAVSFALPVCLPLIGFVPFFRVLGVLPSTGVFTFGGYAFP
jgi:hypothetical protein